MIRIFCGNDNFESYSNAKKQSKILAHEQSTIVEVIESDSIQSIESLVQKIQGVDMFSPQKVLLIKRIFENKKFTDYIYEKFDELNKGAEIVLWENSKIDQRNKLTQKVKKNGLLFIYDEPNESEIRSWLVSYLKSNNIQNDPALVDYIVRNIGNNKNQIKNEVQKIKLYLDHEEKKTLTIDEIDSILGFDVKGNIWSFLDSIGFRRKKQILDEFEKLTTFEDNTQYLISMIHREFDLLLQLKYCEKNQIELKELRIHPFVLKKTQQKSTKFSAKEVRIFLEKLLDLDFAIKRGDIDEKIGLGLYLISI